VEVVGLLVLRVQFRLHDLAEAVGVEEDWNLLAVE